jgi:hypothetical protein
VPAHCLRITAQSTAHDVTSLLCSLLCYTLTSLLCNSCSLLRSGTLKQPSLLGKISASESVLEYHFGIARPSTPAKRTPRANRTIPNTTHKLLPFEDHCHRYPRHPPMAPSSLPPPSA